MQCTPKSTTVSWLLTAVNPCNSQYYWCLPLSQLQHIFHWPYIPDSLELSTLSYCSFSWVSLSFRSLSQIKETCFNVNNGWSFLVGEDPGDDTTVFIASTELHVGALRCLRRCNRFHSRWIFEDNCSVKAKQNSFINLLLPYCIPEAR